ncbi:YegP family protein [Nocardia mangyaensis]|uniref:YegP family protein n=1 Tax=Nocardia mangyaensis TaxID=2213200 RepID=UPI001F0A128A|nr:YegP family protein [Nocardia mangyaensis]
MPVRLARGLKAGNGEIIAAYGSKESAKKGISSVQTNAVGAAIVDTTTTYKHRISKDRRSALST